MRRSQNPFLRELLHLEAFLQSLVLVAISEMGDKTQLLSLVLVARFRKSWTILLGVLVATILNHALASFFGAWRASQVSPHTLTWILARRFFACALWLLIPNKESEGKEWRVQDADEITEYEFSPTIGPLFMSA